MHKWCFHFGMNKILKTLFSVSLHVGMIEIHTLHFFFKKKKSLCMLTWLKKKDPILCSKKIYVEDPK